MNQPEYNHWLTTYKVSGDFFDFNLLMTLYGTVFTCKSRIQPTRFCSPGMPLDELTGRNELLKPPMNQEVESCMLVNDNDDDRLIGADELIDNVPVPERLSCLEEII